jgi:membrane protease YdiL (CAAX protease family)
MMEWLDDALRLLGRLFVLALLSLAIFMLVGMVLKPVFPAGLPPGQDGLLVVSFVSVFALTLGHVGAVLMFERGDWTAAGLHAASWRPLALILATVTGVVVILLPAGALLGTGHLRVAEMPAGSWGGAALEALLWLAAPALFEELAARGYAFGAIERQYGATTALVLTSVAFGLLHLWNPGATPWSLAAVVIAGVFLGSVRLATGSVAAAWLAHLGVNWAQGAVLHAPISGLNFLPTPGYKLESTGPAWLTGGSWGLEAGAPTAATLLVVTFVMLYVARRKQEEVARAPMSRRA